MEMESGQGAHRLLDDEETPRKSSWNVLHLLPDVFVARPRDRSTCGIMSTMFLIPMLLAAFVGVEIWVREWGRGEQQTSQLKDGCEKVGFKCLERAGCYIGAGGWTSRFGHIPSIADRTWEANSEIFGGSGVRTVAYNEEVEGLTLCAGPGEYVDVASARILLSSGLNLTVPSTESSEKNRFPVLTTNQNADQTQVGEIVLMEDGLTLNSQYIQQNIPPPSITFRTKASGKYPIDKIVAGSSTILYAFYNSDPQPWFSPTHVWDSLPAPPPGVSRYGVPALTTNQLTIAYLDPLLSFSFPESSAYTMNLTSCVFSVTVDGKETYYGCFSSLTTRRSGGSDFISFDGYSGPSDTGISGFVWKTTAVHYFGVTHVTIDSKGRVNQTGNLTDVGNIGDVVAALIPKEAPEYFLVFATGTYSMFIYHTAKYEIVGSAYLGEALPVSGSTIVVDRSGPNNSSLTLTYLTLNITLCTFTTDPNSHTAPQIECQIAPLPAALADGNALLPTGLFRSDTLSYLAGSFTILSGIENTPEPLLPYVGGGLVARVSVDENSLTTPLGRFTSPTVNSTVPHIYSETLGSTVSLQRWISPSGNLQLHLSPSGGTPSSFPSILRTEHHTPYVRLQLTSTVIQTTYTYPLSIFQCIANVGTAYQVIFTALLVLIVHPTCCDDRKRHT